MPVWHSFPLLFWPLPAGLAWHNFPLLFQLSSAGLVWHSFPLLFWPLPAGRVWRGFPLLFCVCVCLCVSVRLCVCLCYGVVSGICRSWRHQGGWEQSTWQTHEATTARTHALTERSARRAHSRTLFLAPHPHPCEEPIPKIQRAGTVWKNADWTELSGLD